MPLVRYEIRNEHSLANPQLYRTAAKDDPEGLLEGVAMAGLVGIVRQLGDLAEFAAEVFRDLHEEVMATASRGHDLLARVQQLEAEMPVVEKALLSETNQLRFAYTPGSEWHASIRNDQNHCTQGDLPRFIRNSYEECRGPPRLFLLDKFDVAGAGACLKRYTDPSFFRTEWASSELMKAERVQRDKRARREKKKGRRRRNVEGKDSNPVDQFHTRFSHELSKELMQQQDQAHPRMRHGPVSGRSEEELSALENMNYNENLNALSRHLAEAQGPSRDVTSSSKVSPGYTQEAPKNDSVDELVPSVCENDLVDEPVPAVSEMARSSHSTDLKSESLTSMDNKDVPRKWEETGSDAASKDEVVLQAQQDAGMDVLDDGASEGEQFLDALTTMDSEADTDSEPGFRQEKGAERVFDAKGRQSTSQEDLRLPVLSPTSMDEKTNLSGDQTQTTSQEDMKAPGLYQTSTGEKATQSLEQPLITSQEDMRAPGLSPISTNEIVTPSLEQPLTTSQEDLKTPGLSQTSTVEKATLSREQPLTTSQEDLTVPGYQTSTAEKVNLLVEQSQRSPQEDLSVPGYQTSTAEKVNLSVEQSQTISQEDLSVPGYQPSTGEKVTVSVEQSATSQEDSRMPELKQTSADKTVTPLVEQTSTSRLLDSSGENFPNDSSNIANGQDVKGISSSTTSVHVRRHSIDSISSQSFRKFKHGQLFEKPFESFVARPKLFIPVKDERRVKVSKMVAAFERGSLEHIHDKEPVKETKGIIRESTSLESVAERVNKASVEVEIVGISEDHKSKRNSLQDSRSPLLVSPTSAYSTSTKGSSTKSRGSPSPPAIRVEGRSFSRHVSLGSMDSLPDSPIFSALHSPMSPVRTTRNILSSPDSHSVPFSTELLSPGSPTSVPILAHSPTSRIVPPSFFSLDHRDHRTFQTLNSPTVEESFNHASISTSPTELPLTPQMEEPSEVASPSTTIPKIIDDSSAPLLMPVEVSSDHGSSSSAGSPDALPPSTPPSVSPESESLDNSEELNANLINVPHEVQTSVAKHEPFTSPISPRVEDSLGAVLPPSQSTVDDATIPSMLSNDAPDHEPSKVGGSILVEPIIPPPSPLPSVSPNAPDHEPPKVGGSILVEPVIPPPSPLPSVSPSDFSSKNFQKDKREQLRPSSVFYRSDEFASKVSYSEPTHELPFRPRKAAHKRFPSLPPSEKTTLDFASASFSKLLQDPLAPPKRIPDIQVSTSKFVHDLPSPSLLARTLHDRPLPVSRAAHRRFPSFPPSEQTALEFASASSSRPLQDHQTSSATPSKPAARAQVPASKFVHSLPSPSASLQTLNALPAPIPSNFEQDILPLAPSPSRTLHELPPPPPPLSTPPPLSVAKPSVVVEVQDALLDAIASHDKSTLKKVKTMQNPSLRQGDERSHLLEQIRAQSFNLRHTVVEKVDPPLPRPVTNINVAAILEKANAIRQAFAGSDEDDEDDDDWSDV